MLELWLTRVQETGRRIVRLGVVARLSRVGHVLARLLFELVQVVSIVVGDNGLLAVQLTLGQLVHYGSKRLVRANGDRCEAFRLSVDFVLVEFDLNYVGDGQRGDGVEQVLVRGPPRQIAHIA